MDLKLQADHDLDLKDQTLSLTADGAESVAQRVKINLWLFKGEYFFNTDAGVPYYQELFIKGVTKDEVDDVMKETILGTPGVLEITKYLSDLDRVTREFTMKFTIRTEAGSVEVTV